MMAADKEEPLAELYSKHDFETNVIILKEIPENVDRMTLENYLEVITDNSLIAIFPHHGPHTNIIAVFEDAITDKDTVLSKSKQKKLSGRHVKVHFPSPSRAIVLYGSPPLPSKDHLELSCEKLYGQDCSGSQICNEKGIAVLHFPNMSKADFCRVWNAKPYPRFQFDRMEPYFPDFHDDFIKSHRPSIKSDGVFSSKELEVVPEKILSRSNQSAQMKICQVTPFVVKEREFYQGKANQNATSESEIIYERKEQKPIPNLQLYDDDRGTESNGMYGNQLDDYSDSEESVVSQYSNPESDWKKSAKKKGQYGGRSRIDPNDSTKVMKTMQMQKGKIVMLKIGCISKKAPECKFDLDASHERVIIQGDSEQEVQDAMMRIHKLINTLKEHSVLADPDLVKLFSSSRGSGFVRSTLKKKKTRAFVGFKLESSVMYAYALSMKEARAALTLMDSQLGKHECIINENQFSYLSTPEWNDFMKRSQMENLISIRVDVNDKKIFITGVKVVVEKKAAEVNGKLSSVDKFGDIGSSDAADVSISKLHRNTSDDHTEKANSGMEVNQPVTVLQALYSPVSGVGPSSNQQSGGKVSERISVEEGCARCLKKNTNLIYDLPNIKEWISDVQYKVKKQGQVTIEGANQASVGKAKQCIQDLVAQFWRGEVDLKRISKDDKDIAIMTHSLLSTKCGEFIKMFEQQYACGIVIREGHRQLTLPPSHSSPDISHLKSASSKAPPRSASTSALKSTYESSTPSCSPQMLPYLSPPRLDREEESSHQVTAASATSATHEETVVIQRGKFRAVLRQGKIVREKADILVNFFGVNKNHGVISESFKKVGGEKFNEGLTSSTEEAVSPVEADGDFLCRYVLNIVLEVYRSPQQLQDLQSSIHQCFSWCGFLDATSIAFPAVGIGRLLRYPTDEVAKILKEEAEKAQTVASRLQSVSFIIYDDKTYRTFQSTMMAEKSRQTDLSFLRPYEIPEKLMMEEQHHQEVRGRHHVYQHRRKSEDYRGSDFSERLRPVQTDTELLHRQDDYRRPRWQGHCSPHRKQEGHQDAPRGHHIPRGHHHGNRDRYGNNRNEGSHFDSPRHCHHSDNSFQRDKYHHDNDNKRDKVQGDINIPEVIVTLYCKNKQTGDSVRSKLSKEIKDRFLSEEECDIPFSDKDGKKNIYKICSKYNVYVAEVEKDKKRTLPVLKGEKSSVDKATKEILKYYASGEGSKEVKKRRTNEHKKGTKQYWKFYAEEPPTPSYWRHFRDGVGLIDTFRNLLGKARVERYDVDPKTFSAIKTLVEKTWEPKAGVGADAKNLNHSKLIVRRVERIENIALYHDYAIYRKRLFERLSRTGSFKKLEEIQLRGSNNKCKAIRTAIIDPRMNSDVFPEMNEYYLFHGTKKELEDNITHKGFDNRYSGDNAMFGRGVYVAESSTKADQYADDRNNRGKRGLHMFLVRVLLGEMYVTTVPKRFDLPPCKNCLKEKCTDKEHFAYDSVVGDKSWLFREFVLYRQDQCYPEYVITYDRA